MTRNVGEEMVRTLPNDLLVREGIRARYKVPQKLTSETPALKLRPRRPVPEEQGVEARSSAYGFATMKKRPRPPENDMIRTQCVRRSGNLLYTGRRPSEGRLSLAR